MTRAGLVARMRAAVAAEGERIREAYLAGGPDETVAAATIRVREDLTRAEELTLIARLRTALVEGGAGADVAIQSSPDGDTVQHWLAEHAGRGRALTRLA